MYVNILLAQNIESNHHLISYEVLRHGSIPAHFTRNDWERFVLYISIELFHNQYYCMIFKLPQSPAVFFWFCLYFLLLFFSWTGYNTSSSPIYHFSKTVNNAGSSFDEVRHARNFLCLVPSIIVNKALQLDDEVEGMLFWEKDNPFAKSLGNEVLRWKTLWQSADGELPNNLLLAFGACDEADFPNIYRLLVIACTLLKFWPNPDQVKNLQTSPLKSLQIPGERNTEQRNFFVLSHLNGGCPWEWAIVVFWAALSFLVHAFYAISAFGPFAWGKKYQESARSTTQTLVWASK